MIQTISSNEKFVFMGNRVKAPVKTIRTYHLKLDTGHHLDLLETLYILSLSRNLVSLSKLDITGYSFNFGNGYFSLFKHNHLIGTSVLCDDLHKLKLDGLYDVTILTLYYNVGTKHSLVNEQSAFLWYKRLGHISRKRMEKLIKDEILPDLDFTDLNICVDCTKGKQTKHTKKGATISIQLLEIVYIDICRSFDINSFRKERYFITFIYEYLRYSYFYLNGVERQLDRKVKVVRYDRGGEYYRRYDETGQHPGPFAKLLQKHGICVQYTMSGAPQQNGVSERRNRTLIDVVRSILSNSTLLVSLWMYVLKSVIHLLNRIPSKALPNTHFELWTNKAPACLGLPNRNKDL